MCFFFFFFLNLNFFFLFFKQHDIFFFFFFFVAQMNEFIVKKRKRQRQPTIEPVGSTTTHSIQKLTNKTLLKAIITPFNKSTLFITYHLVHVPTFWNVSFPQYAHACTTSCTSPIQPFHNPPKHPIWTFVFH